MIVMHTKEKCVELHISILVATTQYVSHDAISVKYMIQFFIERHKQTGIRAPFQT